MVVQGIRSGINTRNNGSYSPGLYTRVKITKTILSPQKKVVKRVRNFAWLNYFKIQLKSSILKNLKSTGVCLFLMK